MDLMDLNSVRQVVVASLSAHGPAGKSALAANPASTLIAPGPELPGVLFFRFDSFPHPGASFYVALVGARAFYLTESPGNFTEALRAAGLAVSGPEPAARVARCYVETTRPMREFSRVVDRVEDVTFAPPRDEAERRRIAQAADWVRATVRPPHAEPHGSGFAVALYVLRGPALERRVIVISRDGDITERTESLATALPTPISV